MAPQASQPVPTTGTTATPSMSAHSDADPAPWVPIPVAFSIFLGVCLAYLLSYLLYRLIMSRKRQSETPDSPDRGVSQFMNGARLTLNLGPNKSTALTADKDKSSQVHEEEKPLADTPHVAHSTEVPMSSPAGDLTSSPFIILMASLSMHDVPMLDDAQQHQGSSTPEAEPSTPLTAAKCLSRDRVEAIALDPKLAPVQGPLRPLSMVPTPSPKKRMTLFGLGVKYPRGHVGDPALPAPNPEAR